MAVDTDALRLGVLGKHSINTLCFDPSKQTLGLRMVVKCEETEVINQEKTGTCWLQAGLTMLSTIAKTKLNKDVRFSVVHLSYHDKVGKARAFLERMKRPDRYDARWIWHLRQDPVNDGGTWGMLKHLVRKYGLLTHESMRPTYQSMNTAQMNGYLNQYLRSVVTDEQYDVEAVMANVTHMLKLCYGIHPKKSDDPDNSDYYFGRNVLEYESVKPTEMLERIFGGLFDFEAFVVLADWPEPGRLGRSFYGAFYNDHADEKQDAFRVAKIDELADRALAQLRAGFPVWFTAEVRIDFSNRNGVAAPGILDVAPVLSISMEGRQDKLKRINDGNTAPVHAMLITQASVKDDGEIVAWRVQNSWGKKGFKKGFVEVSHEWFKQHVFQVAVKKQEDEPGATDLEPLAPWDIFSTVAADAGF